MLHVFNTDDVDIAKLHGKVVPYAWFRTQSSANWPDERLLRFQYKQCVQMFFRNYAFGGICCGRDAKDRIGGAGASWQVCTIWMNTGGRGFVHDSVPSVPS